MGREKHVNNYNILIFIQIITLHHGVLKKLPAGNSAFYLEIGNTNASCIKHLHMSRHFLCFFRGTEVLGDLSFFRSLKFRFGGSKFRRRMGPFLTGGDISGNPRLSDSSSTE